MVLLYLALGLGYALKVPKWNAPDEPAHFNYVRHVATTGTLPVLQMGDYNQEYLSELTSTNFPDSKPIDAIRYESHQPPLYYALAAAVYRLADGGSLDRQVLALRLFSLLFGAAVVVSIYAVGREAFPIRPLWALGAACFAAGVPMHIAMSAAVENDSLGILLLSLVLLVSLGGLRAGFSTRRCVLMGALIGLTLLTKVTAYVAAVLPLAAFLLRARLKAAEASPALEVSADGEPALALLWKEDQANREPPLSRRLLLVYGTALALSWWWFVRNALTYGGLDIFGLGRHNEVVVGQPRTVFNLDGLTYFVTTTFQSFWAQFGWMGIVVDRRIYLALALLSAFVLLGLIVFAWRLWRRPARLAPTERAALLLLVLTLALVVGELLYYNLTFIQAQGRYLFPAMAAIALLFVVGFLELVPRPLHTLGVVGLYFALVALDIVCLVRFVAPYFGTL